MKGEAAVLALETSTDLCSVALATGGRIKECTRETPREHTRHVLGQVDELLHAAGLTVAELDAVAFGRGPGTFTGVRLATAVAQGLAVARGLSLLPVSSLAALAWRCWREDAVSPVLAAMDARLEQVYWGMYTVDSDTLSVLHSETLSSPAQLQAALSSLPGDWHGAGSGAALPGLRDAIGTGAGEWRLELRPDARAVLELALVDFRAGRTAGFDQAQPLYLRDPVRPQ